MPNAGKAHQFHTRMKQHWNRSQMVDARELAKRMGAQPIRPFASQNYEVVPGDLPATLWRWPDQTEFVIMDSGNMVHAARKRGERNYCEG